MGKYKILLTSVLLVLPFFLFPPCTFGKGNPVQAPEFTSEGLSLPIKIPVVVVSYFPTKTVSGKKVFDRDVASDLVEDSLETYREIVKNLTPKIIDALEEGSRYHGYKNPYVPKSLQYEVVGEYEVEEAIPTIKKPGRPLPVPDYAEILQRINVKDWVENKGVKQFWLFAYHGRNELAESKMSSPYGDISNSYRYNDLPKIPGKTYTLYHYNYGRTEAEAVEDHCHQLEAVFRWVDEDMFWNRFVGYFPSRVEGSVPMDQKCSLSCSPNASKDHASKNRRCGWTHYPPNALKDYDWENPDSEESDIEDWQPEGCGPRKPINVETWRDNPNLQVFATTNLRWKVYWLQNIPGFNNGLTFKGNKLTNWWVFIGDLDYAIKNKIGMVKSGILAPLDNLVKNPNYYLDANSLDRETREIQTTIENLQKDPLYTSYVVAGATPIPENDRKKLSELFTKIEEAEKRLTKKIEDLEAFLNDPAKAKSLSFFQTNDLKAKLEISKKKDQEIRKILWKMRDLLKEFPKKTGPVTGKALTPIGKPGPIVTLAPEEARKGFVQVLLDFVRNFFRDILAKLKNKKPVDSSGRNATKPLVPSPTATPLPAQGNSEIDNTPPAVNGKTPEGSTLDGSF